jgi:hypothetical protein
MFPTVSAALLDGVHELGHLIVNRATFLHPVADLFDRMDDRGVIPTPNSRPMAG